MLRIPGVYSFFVPEFLESQRSSFINLLKEGISREFEKINPIRVHVDYYPIIKKDKLYQDNERMYRSLVIEEKDFLLKSQTPTLPFSFQFAKNVDCHCSVCQKFIEPRTKKTKFHFVQPKIKSRSPWIQNDSFNLQRYTTNNPRYLRRFKYYRGFTLYNLQTNLPARKQIQIIFESKEWQLSPPIDSIKSALFHFKTYQSELSIPISFQNEENQIRIRKKISITNLPIMTNRGHFIINGTPKVVLHQLVRSPGVYFHKVKKKANVYADIICDRGVWLRIETTKKGLILAKIKNAPKIPMNLFLQSFGLENPHLLSQMYSNVTFGTQYHYNTKSLYPTSLELGPPSRLMERANYTNPFFLSLFDFDADVRNRKTKRYRKKLLKEQTNLIKNQYNLSILQRKIFSKKEDAREVLTLVLDRISRDFQEYKYYYKYLSLIYLRKKFGSKRYDLNDCGRVQLNRKLGLNKPLSCHILTLDDLICITNYLLKVQAGEFPTDDIDDLQNKRVRCSGELIQNIFGEALLNFKRVCQKQPNEDKVQMLNYHPFFFGAKNPMELQKFQPRNSKPLRNHLSLKKFFNSSPLCQYLDQTNPLAEITHKRRLSSLGPGGVTADTASMKMRGIHPSHYGRICPIETPDGKNAGIVNSLTTYARINHSGFIETPYFLVENGQLQKNEQILYASSSQDSNNVIAPSDIQTDSLCFLKGINLPVRIDKEFTNVDPQEIDFMAISRVQMISIATSLIPFLEHDDANRALMGSNMQRQAVPLVRPEKPIVSTGLEGRVFSDSQHSINARESGVVIYASSQQIKILSFFEKSEWFKIKNSKIEKDLIQPLSQSFLTNFKMGIICYKLEEFQRSNQNTSFTQRPLVTEGQWVEKGDCLVDSSSTSFGELAVGKNVLVAYLPWEGFNYEDAILVSERVIYDDLFTSIHISRHKIEIKKTKNGIERFSREQLPENENTPDEFLYLDTHGIVKKGTWVSEGDILVRKLTPRDKKKISPYQKFLYAILDENIPTTKDTSLRVPKGINGRVIHIQVQPDNVYPKSVCLFIAEKKWLQIGDKMAGRHGNKGIVSNILPIQDMPYLPDGTPVDIVLNPLGVPSRMNVGQLFECLLGLAGKHLKENYKLVPFDEISGPEASRSIVFSKLYEARKKTGQHWLFQPEHPGKMRLFDGRTGQAFDQAITVGQPYMLKLIHMVDDKIHARSTGPYSLITQQPLRGRSKQGGQRLGEMEVWALEGFGAAYTLQEILTFKSDDILGRNQVMDYLLDGTQIKVGTPESFRVLTRELQALCINVNVFIQPIQKGHLKPTPFDIRSTDPIQ
jgi:DNA-directed RNA polymerase subunit beta